MSRTGAVIEAVTYTLVVMGMTIAIIITVGIFPILWPLIILASVVSAFIAVVVLTALAAVELMSILSTDPSSK